MHQTYSSYEQETRIRIPAMYSHIRDSEREMPDLPELIDRRSEREMLDLWEALASRAIDLLRKAPYRHIIKTILSVIVDIEKRIATIITQPHFQYFSRLLNRRFRNGRHSRRLLLHHAYQICSSSLEMFLAKYCLANGTSTRS